MKKALLAILLLGLIRTETVQAHVRRATHPIMVMEATAFARAHQPTAAGTTAHFGIIAADPTVLPLGSRIRILGPTVYAGIYLVTDTGALVKGRHIDVYLPSRREARHFGQKAVRVQILQVGHGKKDARRKDEAMLRRPEPEDRIR